MSGSDEHVTNATPFSQHFAAGRATALLGVCPTALADEPPETRTIRFARNASICVFPQYYLQETLRGEGFSEIGYVEASAVRTLEPLARGAADFSINFCLGTILEIDAGSPITILGGVMSAVTSCLLEKAFGACRS